MLHWWQDELEAEARRLRVWRAYEEARLYRQVRAAQRAQGDHAHFHHRVLAWLGDRMVHWGSGLQERYAPQMRAT